MRSLKILMVCSALFSAGASNAAEINHESLSDGVGIITIEGRIEAGDLEKFRQISIRYKDAIVGLNSEGGALLPAIEIGKIIKIAGYSTVVPEAAYCTSSCALIWVAGPIRLLSPEGHVGFHAAYKDNNGRSEESGVANAVVGSYLTLLGLPQKAIIFATSAPPDKILWLTKANMDSAGIEFKGLDSGGSKTTDQVPASPSPRLTLAPPPPLETPTQRQAPTPPIALPAALTKAGESWVEYSPSRYINESSVRHATDEVYGNKVVEFWSIIGSFSKKERPAAEFAMLKFYVNCQQMTLSTRIMLLLNENGDIIPDTVFDFSSYENRKYVSISSANITRIAAQKLCYR